MSDLKPCPFCGDAPRLTHESLDERSGYGYIATVSSECGAKISRANKKDAQGWNNELSDSVDARAVEAWNRRA